MCEHIGPQIRAARLRRRLTLEQLADRSGIHYCTLSRIERDKVDPSFRAHLVPIAKGLKLRVSTLLRTPQPTNKE